MIEDWLGGEGEEEENVQEEEKKRKKGVVEVQKQVIIKNRNNKIKRRRKKENGRKGEIKAQQQKQKHPNLHHQQFPRPLFTTLNNSLNQVLYPGSACED